MGRGIEFLLLSGWLCGWLKPLCGKTDNCSDDTTGQHYFKIVVLARFARHGGYQVGKQQTDRETEEYAQRQRVHFLGEVARRGAGHKAFERRTNYDSEYLVADFGGEPSSHPVKCSQYRAE